jgi:hypothetical protein
MKKTLIFILAGATGPSRDAIITRLQSGTTTEVITKDFSPSEEEERERVERGGMPWNQLDETIRRDKAQIYAVRNILNGKKDQFIVNRPGLTNEEIFIYSYLHRSSECTVLTLKIAETAAQSYLDKGDIIFANGNSVKLLSDQIIKGNDSAILINKEMLENFRNLLNTDQTLQEVSGHERENLIFSHIDEKVIDALANGISLIVIDRTMLEPSDIELYKRLSTAKRYRHVTIDAMEFDPKLVELKFSNIDDLDKQPMNVEEYQLSPKKSFWSKFKFN